MTDAKPEPRPPAARLEFMPALKKIYALPFAGARLGLWVLVGGWASVLVSQYCESGPKYAWMLVALLTVVMCSWHARMMVRAAGPVTDLARAVAEGVGLAAINIFFAMLFSLPFAVALSAFTPHECRMPWQAMPLGPPGPPGLPVGVAPPPAAAPSAPVVVAPVVVPRFDVEPDPGLLLLLVRDGQLYNDARVTAWIDAASETGVRIQPIMDTQFLALGERAQEFAGLILPDLLHTVAGDLIVDAVYRYTSAGGKTMLVYDFAALDDSSGKPVYVNPKSRMSTMAGLGYVLYEQKREKMSALGPVIATRSTMRKLLVPPGKSLPYLVDGVAQTALTPADVLEDQSPAKGRRAPPRKAPKPVPEPLEGISGYQLGMLKYYSYATDGEFDGTVLATSPGNGLVAGERRLGKGRVLFVNLPLTYLKGRTDALPMHGFLQYFARDMLQMAFLSPMPDGVAGITLNWHLDSNAAQKPLLELETLGVFNDPNALFSIDMTAGPDTRDIGDKLGWDLDNNPVAQALLQRFDKFGHSVGAHGGWVHDYYGKLVNETNKDTFLPFLQKNRDAVNKAIGHPIREYSAPLGNNPAWAMEWLESQGVVAAYFAGHTGLGATRQYRDGILRSPKMWIFPVTPFGETATFEEWQARNLPHQDVLDWYHELIDFVVDKNTSRLIYMHPPEAAKWSDVVQEMLAYGKKQQQLKRFAWYTMPRLADFMTARHDVRWTEKVDAQGASHFRVEHPTSLKEMAWLLPKSRYPRRPVVLEGAASIGDSIAPKGFWQVKAAEVPLLEFVVK